MLLICIQGHFPVQHFNDSVPIMSVVSIALLVPPIAGLTWNGGVGGGQRQVGTLKPLGSIDVSLTVLQINEADKK